MYTWGQVLENFFTHKDFLPPPEQWPGTLFTPEQILFCAAVAVCTAAATVRCARKNEAFQKKVFLALWGIMVVTEFLLGWWEVAAGMSGKVDWASSLSLWPCSLTLYTVPIAVFGKGDVRKAACGYICTLGLLGGLINFVYPANYLSRYSFLSMAGFRTLFYHGAMVFMAAVMLLSGYHSFKGVKSRRDLLLPMVPVLVMSVPAIAANFLIPGADYMFFRLESFFFAPIGQALPDWATIPMVYGFYAIVHITPYLPSYLSNRTVKPGV